MDGLNQLEVGKAQGKVGASGAQISGGGVLLHLGYPVRLPALDGGQMARTAGKNQALGLQFGRVTGSTDSK
jgi:hypothetical protein